MTARKVDIIDAVKAGDAPMVHTLLCAGLDPNRLYSGQTALMQACELGLVDVAELLITNGAHTDTTDRYGRTALHCAARFGHIDCVRLLIAANARDDLRADLLGGETALDVARGKAHLDVVKLLMYGQKDLRPSAAGAGADPYAKKKAEAAVAFGDRSIASGGASGATFAGRYTAADAPPLPLPPPFAVQPTPVVDETRRLAPQPKYGH